MRVCVSQGSGKSTLAALLTRLYDTTEGSVRVDGRDVRDVDPTWLRSSIGVVPQEPTLFGASIADNIRYGQILVPDTRLPLHRLPPHTPA